MDDAGKEVPAEGVRAENKYPFLLIVQPEKPPLRGKDVHVNFFRRVFAVFPFEDIGHFDWMNVEKSFSPFGRGGEVGPHGGRVREFTVLFPEIVGGDEWGEKGGKVKKDQDERAYPCGPGDVFYDLFVSHIVLIYVI